MNFHTVTTDNLNDGFTVVHAGDFIRWGYEDQQNLWDGVDHDQFVGLNLPPYFFNLSPRVLEAMEGLLPLLTEADSDRFDIEDADPNLV